MSAFNPNARQLTPQEWQNIAIQSVDGNNSQFIIIGGIVAGLFVASGTGFLPSGILVAAYGLYSAWQRTQKINHNEIAINEYGCVAHVLKGQDFRDFRKQVGDEEVLKQLRWAIDNGYSPSTDALNFLEVRQRFSPKSIEPSKVEAIAAMPSGFIAPALPEDYHQAPAPTPTQTQTISFERETPDLAKKMAEELKNSLIIGVPGVGKDYFISNALEWVRKFHPNCTIFFVDPKNDPKETGYFEGRVDYLFRLNICERSPQETHEWVQRCLETYDKFDAGTGLKLLVFNEIAATNKTLTNVKGALNWLTSKMIGYSSSGDSRGIKIWGVSQNAHNSGIGFDGGSKSIFTPFVIVSESQLSASEQVLRAQIIPNDKRLKSDEIKALCERSPVKRAIFHGGLNEWFPMPKMTNYSNYDRDSRTFIQDKSQSQTQKLIQQLEKTSQPTIEAFIEFDLRITDPTKKQQMQTAIAQVLKASGRQDLISKFAVTI